MIEIKKAQTAVELIIILAIALVIFMAIISINQDVTTSVSNRFEVTKAKTALEDLANAAELVYQQGEGAKTRVYITMPNGVETTSVSGTTLDIQMYAGGNLRNVYRALDFDVSGNIPTEEGNYWVSVEAFDTYVAIGDVVITCPDGTCEAEEECPQDANTCPDSVCYDPTCTFGCGLDAITETEDPGECDSSVGCGSPPCYCDISSNCVSAPAQVCGNSIPEGTEACDDGNTVTEGCGDGTVQSGTYCNADCTVEFTLSEACELGDSQACTDGDGYPGTQDCLGDCSAFDVCTSTEFCGDNTINGPEVCDGTDLTPYTSDCSTYPGYDGGTLACLGDCSDYDTSGCTVTQVCGDGTPQGTEACDDGNTVTEGCGDGTVQSGTYCNADCTVEFTLSETCELGDSQACTDGDGYPGTQDCLGDCSAFDTCISTEFCGDNTINGPEICDGTDLTPYTSDCSTYPGYIGGTLSCFWDCTGFDTSACTTPTQCVDACFAQYGWTNYDCRTTCGGSHKDPAPAGDTWCQINEGFDRCCCRK